MWHMECSYKCHLTPGRMEMCLVTEGNIKISCPRPEAISTAVSHHWQKELFFSSPVFFFFFLTFWGACTLLTRLCWGPEPDVLLSNMPVPVEMRLVTLKRRIYIKISCSGPEAISIAVPHTWQKELFFQHSGVLAHCSRGCAAAQNLMFCLVTWPFTWKRASSLKRRMP